MPRSEHWTSLHSPISGTSKPNLHEQLVGFVRGFIVTRLKLGPKDVVQVPQLDPEVRMNLVVPSGRKRKLFFSPEQERTNVVFGKLSLPLSEDTNGFNSPLAKKFKVEPKSPELSTTDLLEDLSELVEFEGGLTRPNNLKRSASDVLNDSDNDEASYCISSLVDTKRRKKRAPIEPVRTPPSLVSRAMEIHGDDSYEWRQNFLRKCADLVEVRFANAIRVTCVKPFYEIYGSCWTPSDVISSFEVSSLPHHQDGSLTSTNQPAAHGSLTESETAILTRKFFLICRAYNLRHPYLLASIQTGLETRKDLFDFNKFRTEQQIIPKLCVDLPERSALACISQLRVVLAPRVLPFSRFETERIVLHLFAGFGPDWMTIAKLTGLNLNSLKCTVALKYGADPLATSQQTWYDIHQLMLNDSELDSRKGLAEETRPRGHENSPRNFCSDGKLPPFELIRNQWRQIFLVANQNL